MDSKGVLLQAVLNGISSVELDLDKLRNPKHASCLSLCISYVVISLVINL